MENALLVGLSRQMILERQLDVVANNIANVNTTGFKADNSLFEEYLNSGAHEDNFKSADRRVSYVQDRGTFRDFTQGALEQTNNPLDVAISGDGFLVVQTAGGERYTRDGNLQINTTGPARHRRAAIRCWAPRGPIVFQPTDHDINISPRRHRHGAGRHRPHRFDPRQAPPRQLHRRAEAAEGGPQPLFRRRRRRARAADTKSTVRQGFVEKSNVNSVAEMSRMIEVTAPTPTIANMLQQEATCTNPRSKSSPTCRPKPDPKEKSDHASASHCSDRNGGPGTQRPGHLQQHREHATPPATRSRPPHSRT